MENKGIDIQAISRLYKTRMEPAGTVAKFEALELEAMEREAIRTAEAVKTAIQDWFYLQTFKAFSCPADGFNEAFIYTGRKIINQ